MLDTHRYSERTQKETTPSLVLPHEFYGRKRKQVEFRKDLSCQLTKSFQSFSQKKTLDHQGGKVIPAFRVSNKKASKNESSVTNLRTSYIRSGNELKFREDLDNAPKVPRVSINNKKNDDAEINCKTDDEQPSSLCETTRICNLVNHIEYILHSDMFANQDLEEELLQEVSRLFTHTKNNKRRKEN